MPSSTEDMDRMLEWVKKLADDYDVKVEMLTHDHITGMSPTGRIRKDLFDPMMLHDPFRQSPAMLHSSKKGWGDVALDIDYAQFELRLLASCIKAGVVDEERSMSVQVECVDCKTEFEVTDGEEKFLKERFGDDFSMPKRCKTCRQAKKASRNQQRR